MEISLRLHLGPLEMPMSLPLALIDLPQVRMQQGGRADHLQNLPSGHLPLEDHTKGGIRVLLGDIICTLAQFIALAIVSYKVGLGKIKAAPTHPTSLATS